MVALSKLTGAPMPKKMKSKQKKNFVEDSVAWLRENDPGRLDTVDDATVETLTKLAGIPYESRPTTKTENKRKAMEDALNWIRNNDLKVDEEPRDNVMVALSKLTGAPMPKKMKSKQKKKFVEDSVAWLRENDP